nr:piggyBac transposable element-derived protein 5-like [Procambarus clarkii]
MDRGQGQSSSTPKKATKTTKELKLSMLYKKFSRVRLTRTKIPGMLDELFDIDADVEGEERESDFNSDNLDTETADDGESTSEESSEESEEDDDPRPQPPIRKRAGRLQQPDPEDAWCTDNTPPSVDTFTGTPGLTVPLPTTAIQFIQLFLTRALIEYFTFETNLYTKQFIQNASRRTTSIWQEVSVKEMARYLGLSMLMGVAALPTMRMYWQTSRLWHMRTFNIFMTSKRFQHISQFFNSYNNQAIPPNNKDRLIKERKN